MLTCWLPENPYLVYGILKYRKRFEDLRIFTLEGGQQEIERQQARQKAEGGVHDATGGTRQWQSYEEPQTPAGARASLSRIPEENSPFTIGGDDSDEDGEEQQTPSQSSPTFSQNSRRPSLSSTDENSPFPIRGMSEKARGKMPAGRPSISRQNSLTSQSSLSLLAASSVNFTPTPTWVSYFASLVPADKFLAHLFLIARVMVA